MSSEKFMGFKDEADNKEYLAGIHSEKTYLVAVDPPRLTSIENCSLVKRFSGEELENLTNSLSYLNHSENKSVKEVIDEELDTLRSLWFTTRGGFTMDNIESGILLDFKSR